MIHIGDIKKINGAEIEPVDVIVGGSPCQDLSVAGKRLGLAGKRSGLYMEQIRIVKEMRERERRNGRAGIMVRLRYMLWENVPGAFSSNKGRDFAAVIEEAIRIAESEAPDVPVPEKGWPKSGCLYSELGEWSLAWRVLDAQFWGVPQRRKRIALIIDFGGMSAPEILFEREGVRGYFAQSGTQRKAVTEDAKDRIGADYCEGAIPINTMIATRHKQLGRGTGFGVGEAGAPQFTISAGHEHAVAYTLKICDENILDDQGGQKITVRTDGKAPTLRAETHGNLPAVMEPVTIEPGIAAREGGHIYEGMCGTLRANAGDNQMAVAYAAGFKAGQGAQARSIGWEDEKCPTLAAEAGGNSVPSVCVKCYDARGNGDGQTVSTLTGDHENRITDYTSVVVEKSPVYCLQGNGIDRADTAGCNGKGWKEDTCYTLNTIDRPAVAFAMQAFGDYKDCGVCSGLKARDCKDATDLVVESAGIDCRNLTEYPELYPTLQAKPNGGQSLNFSGAVRVQYIVRRITPTECERLQGFPDGWTDIGEWIDSKGKLHKSSDTARYKALGNSIALPPWKYILKRISAQYERDATLGSLFDGIGGFPLIWEKINGKGSARWESEIEEFPIAVTKRRLEESDNG